MQNKNEKNTKGLNESTEFFKDQKILDGMVFPISYYRPDGSYIPVFESYRESIIQWIADERIAPTGSIVSRLNLTPREVSKMGLYSPSYCPHTGGLLSSIETNQKYFDSQPYPLSLQLLDIYGIRRYKKHFYLYYENHYELVSDETLKQIIRDTFVGLAERRGESRYADEVLRELKNNPRIVVTDRDICRDKVAFRNCCFDLKTMMPVPPSRDDVMMYSINANFLPDVFYNEAVRNASTPVFDGFLNSIGKHDALLTERIWQTFGYVITPDNYGRSFFVLQGVPASGKSTIERLLVRMFSPGSVFRINGEELGTRFAFQGLEGKGVIIVSDMPDKDISRGDVSSIKQCSGRDGMNSDVKHGERTQFETDAKMLCFTNYPFSGESYDQALYDRAVTIPFQYSVPKSQQDFDLDEKLAAEIDAIATKSLFYYITLRENSYQFTGNYMLNQCVQSCIFSESALRTSIYCFAREHCYADPNGTVFTLDAHQMFCSMFGRNVDITSFSELFRSATEELFGARKGKIRQHKGENPRNAMLGIAIKA